MMQNHNRNQRTPNRPPAKKVPILFKDDTYVNEAEQVILELKKDYFKVGRDLLTTSQIRNLVNLTSTLFDEAQRQDYSELTDRIAYLRVQFVYQSGRNLAVKKLVETANILKILQEVQDKKDKKILLRFCRYMEALVAYFKYYGGRDS